MRTFSAAASARRTQGAATARPRAALPASRRRLVMIGLVMIAPFDETDASASIATLDVTPGKAAALQQLHELVEHDSDDGQIDEHREHQRRIEAALGDDDERAQATVGADILA